MDYKNMVIHIDLLNSVRSLLGFSYNKKLTAVGVDGNKTITRTDHEFSLGFILISISLVIPEKVREAI